MKKFKLNNCYVEYEKNSRDSNIYGFDVLDIYKLNSKQSKMRKF